MQVGQIKRWKDAFAKLPAEALRVLAETFVASDPLNTLYTAARLFYDKPGVRRAQVLRQLRENDAFVTYDRLHREGVISGPSGRLFLEHVERDLMDRKKPRR